MAQLSLSCFVLLLAIPLTIHLHLNHSSPVLAVASQDSSISKQIQNICSKTLEPNECFRCIRKDPNRDPDDIPELIHALTFCMYSQLTFAHVSVDVLSRNTSARSLKRTLSKCSSLLFNAENLAIEAMMNMESKKYAKAWECARFARSSMFRCARLFSAHNDLSIPNPVLDQMIYAKRLYDSMHVLFVQIAH